jgi:diadenosine tetraphosphatase ApaH/serine/threonine PP2A family protein phosphatase
MTSTLQLSMPSSSMVTSPPDRCLPRPWTGWLSWVRGNADRELVAAYAGALNPDLPEAARAPTEYCASRLDSRHRDLLANLPLSIAIDVAGLGPVRFCHATTCSDTEIVLVDSPIERYREAFTDTDEPTVVLGHTHMPFDRLAERRRFVNPGSVGCRTELGPRFGRCSVPTSPCAALSTTPT